MVVVVVVGCCCWEKCEIQKELNYVEEEKIVEMNNMYAIQHMIMNMRWHKYMLMNE